PFCLRQACYTICCPPSAYAATEPRSVNDIGSRAPERPKRLSHWAFRQKMPCPLRWGSDTPGAGPGRPPGSPPGRPALVLLEQGERELIGVLHPHAAMALGPDRLGEQVLLRGVVHIHIVLVGEHEFEIAEHVVRPGRLVDVEAADVDAVPIDLCRVDVPAADVDAPTLT